MVSGVGVINVFVTYLGGGGDYLLNWVGGGGS